MAFISRSTLRGDIYNYKRIQAKDLSINRYVAAERIVEKAENILAGYEQNKLHIHNSDHKLMARYIETFGFLNRENLLDKLQSESYFNVRDYLSEMKKTWWQRLFNITPPRPGYLSGKKLQKRLDKYHKISKKLSKGFYHNADLYNQQIRLENQAISYAQDFVSENFQIKPEDKPILYEYWQTFAKTSNETIINDALQQLSYTPQEDAVVKPSIKERFASWMSAAKQKLARQRQEKAAKPARPTVSDKSGAWNNIKTNIKNNFASWMSTAKQKLAQQHQEKAAKPARPTVSGKPDIWNRVKVFGLAALVTVSGIFIFKSSQNESSKNTPKQEIKATPKKADISNNTKILQPAAQQLTKEQKMWQNFYNTKNEMLANMLKTDAVQLNNIIQSQAAKGIFSIPQNATSEQMVYTHLIYKAYGLPSPFDNVLTAKQKVSAQQQNEIVTAVKTAGNNGLGVKKLAQKIAAKSGKKLNKKSAFNMASKKQQQTYISNLKQIRQLNHR